MAKTVLAVVSDLHCGSTVALCPESIALDDGGHYVASKAQRWLWERWNAYWGRVQEVLDANRGAAFYQVFNGDMVDGDHHGTSQILSGNLNAQSAATTASMAVPLAMNPDKIFIIRGTEVHVGKSGGAEERIADGLRRDKRPIVCDPDTGTASWWHMKAEIDGVRLDFAHHGRTGQREHTRANAANLHAYDILLSHIKTGDPHPHLCIRSHYHRFNDSGDASPVRVVTTGAWQLKTGFVHRIAADTVADIGGIIITIENGEYEVEKVKYTPARAATWKP